MNKRLQLGLFIILLTLGNLAMAIEEPQYEILSETEEYEIRKYSSYIVAEVDVSGDVNRPDSDAFKILAGYIFGNNQSKQKMNMTAPVVSELPDEEQSEYTYAFVMESRFSLDNLPVPDDSRIRIVEKEGRVVAVKKYTGRWTESNFRKNDLLLKNALEKDGLTTVGSSFLARYNSPFSLSFVRRNEVLIELELNSESN